MAVRYPVATTVARTGEEVPETGALSVERPASLAARVRAALDPDELRTR